MCRIILLSRGWYPFVHGGADKFIARLAEKLAERKYNVIAITRGNVDHLDLRLPYRLIIVRYKQNIPFLSSALFSRLSARIANKLRPDLVIVNGYWAEASPLFIDKKIPVLLIIHDVGLFRSSWIQKHKFKHWLRVFILRRNIIRAIKIVVPTELVKKDIIRFLKVNEKKIIVLGTEGVDGPYEYRSINNGFYDIVQIARFAPNKGQIFLLKAFNKVIREIPYARLWLVGGGPSSKEQLNYFRLIIKYAEKINAIIGTEAVKIVVDADDVNKYFEIADVCVAPSLGEEGYGLALVECMAYGKPVIASPIFRQTGVADYDRAVIVDPMNIDEFAEAIIKLLKDKKLYRRLSSNALRYAKKCDWDMVADVFDRIIREILQG